MTAPSPRHAALLLTLLGVLWCALIVAPPFLASAGLDAGAAMVRFLFAPVCHQIPERSFHILGSPLPVCARCAGIYGGALLAFILAAAGVRARAAMRGTASFLAAAAVPSLATWILAGAGLISDAAVVRAVAGAVLGAAVGACLVPALEALCAEIALHRSNPRASLNRPAGPSQSLTTGG